MQAPSVQVSVDADHKDEITALVNRRIERLKRLFDRITHLRVSVRQPHRHQTRGRIYEVHVDLGVAGSEVNVSRQPSNDHSHEDMRAAVRDAFDTAERHAREALDKRNKH